MKRALLWVVLCCGCEGAGLATGDAGADASVVAPPDAAGLDAPAPAVDAPVATDGAVDAPDVRALDGAPLDGGGGCEPRPSDPSTSVLSYLGGGASHVVDDQARDVAVDAAGNLYVVGALFRYRGTFFTGAARRTVGGGGSADVFVVKVAPDGSVVYATLIGGAGYDRAYAVEVDASGRAVVAGRAGDGFPVTAGAYETTFQGDDSPNPAYGPQDAFVLRLNADGSLDWASYVGEPGRAFARDVAIDSMGRPYLAITGIRGSFAHVTPSSFGPASTATDHGAIVALSADGSRLRWGANLGAPGASAPTGVRPSIQIGPSGDVFVAYQTSAGDEPVTAGALQPSYGGGEDAFVTRIRGDGSAVVYATYFGGAAAEYLETHHLAVDGTDRAILAVDTTSRTIAALPAGEGFRPAPSGDQDVVVVVLAALGTRVEHATYWGGTGSDHVEGVSTDPVTGDVVISGLTHSSDLPITIGAAPRGGANTAGMLASFSCDLRSLRVAMVMDGSGNDDQLRGVAVAPDGAYVAAGHTNSMDLTVRGATPSSYGGGPHDAVWLRVVP